MFEGKLAEGIRSSGAPLYILPRVRLSRPWTTRQSRRALGTLLDRLPPFDAILTHASWPHAVYAPVLARHKQQIIFLCSRCISALNLDRSCRKASLADRRDREQCIHRGYDPPTFSRCAMHNLSLPGRIAAGN